MKHRVDVIFDPNETLSDDMNLSLDEVLLESQEKTQAGKTNFEWPKQSEAIKKYLK